MLRIVYTCFLYLLLPLILIRLFLRSLRSSAYRRRIAERFALNKISAPLQGQETIWIHAVSVGEVMAAVPVIRALLTLKHTVLVTTTTPTGSSRVCTEFGDAISHQYLPYDLPDAMSRFLTKTQPALLVIMETELWPNLIHSCTDRGVKILLANARLSAKSAQGYGRFSRLSRKMLSSINIIAAQSEEDAERFRALGAEPESLSIIGNLKYHYDNATNSSLMNGFFAAIKKTTRPVLIAASTREGEEKKVLLAYQSILKKHPNLLLIIVPRHPERFSSVFKLCAQKGFAVLKRSDEPVVLDEIQIIVGDSMGEMPAYYSISTIAFVGGSLVDTGCQNVLEPASLSIPVVVGPSQYNFLAVCQALEKAGGLVSVANESGLAAQVNYWLEHPEEALFAGHKAQTVVNQNQDALPKVLALIEQLWRERKRP